MNSLESSARLEQETLVFYFSVSLSSTDHDVSLIGAQYHNEVLRANAL